MRTLALSACLLILSVYAAFGFTVEDVIKLKKAGAGDDVIVNYVNASDSTPKLSVDDIILLKKEGVSEEVINHILKAGKPEPVKNAEEKDEKTVDEPEHIKKFDSIFYIRIYEYKFRGLVKKKVDDYGKFNPLKNKADSEGMIYFTEKGILFIENETTRRWEVSWSDITNQKIRDRFPTPERARHHKLTRYEWELSYNVDGEKRLASIYVTRAPRAPSELHATIQKLSETLLEIGAKHNPRIKPAEEVW